MVDMHFVPSLHDANVVGHIFDVKPSKIRILPYGVDDEFLNAQRRLRAEHLICTATITERKRVLALAQAAFIAKTPLWIVGKTYGSNDEYGNNFRDFIYQTNGLIKHIPHVDGREALAKMLTEARGFVLLSTMETVSQSALEAASCGSPLLLSDLDWARVAFGKNALYCDPYAKPVNMANKLKSFYEICPSFSQNFQAGSWFDQRACLREILDAL